VLARKLYVRGVCWPTPRLKLSNADTDGHWYAMICPWLDLTQDFETAQDWRIPVLLRAP
jgi:hypothetical protein